MSELDKIDRAEWLRGYFADEQESTLKSTCLGILTDNEDLTTRLDEANKQRDGYFEMYQESKAKELEKFDPVRHCVLKGGKAIISSDEGDFTVWYDEGTGNFISGNYFVSLGKILQSDARPDRPKEQDDE